MSSTYTPQKKRHPTSHPSFSHSAMHEQNVKTLEPSSAG